MDIVQRELGTHPILSLSWSAVLCCRSKPAHGDHISTYLNADHGEMLSQVEHVNMAPTAGAAGAINCKA